ncbi:LOW QUALITY PROTEIN: Retrotransposon protein [Phytophthora megakarya]|uniref:Retrotransposon protein n=1 Tax=Phytophthora megakarya TaxID=4795 RepID=A0A225W6F7_9STRA|nr:LOW QUALITY PROTEIN: Retrotransposon protein [Phytophthora megakarya]
MPRLRISSWVQQRVPWGNGILSWLDDILVYAEDEETLQMLLDKVLRHCEGYSLKLHLKNGVENQLGRRHQALTRASSGTCGHLPETVADPQQYLRAGYGMRQIIPKYTRVAAELYDVLGRTTKEPSSSKKRALAGVKWMNVG